MITISYFKHKDGRAFAMQKEGDFRAICSAIFREMQKGHVFVRLEALNPNNDYKKDLTSIIHIEIVKTKAEDSPYDYALRLHNKSKAYDILISNMINLNTKSVKQMNQALREVIVKLTEGDKSEHH